MHFFTLNFWHFIIKGIAANETAQITKYKCTCLHGYTPRKNEKQPMQLMFYVVSTFVLSYNTFFL